MINKGSCRLGCARQRLGLRQRGETAQLNPNENGHKFNFSPRPYPSCGPGGADNTGFIDWHCREEISLNSISWENTGGGAGSGAGAVSLHHTRGGWSTQQPLRVTTGPPDTVVTAPMGAWRGGGETPCTGVSLGLQPLGGSPRVWHPTGIGRTRRQPCWGSKRPAPSPALMPTGRGQLVRNALCPRAVPGPR